MTHCDDDEDGPVQLCEVPQPVCMFTHAWSLRPGGGVGRGAWVCLGTLARPMLQRSEMPQMAELLEVIS
jgi:hypothetical protein